MNRVLEHMMLFLCLAVFTCIVLLVGIMVGAFWFQDFFPPVPACGTTRSCT